MNTQNHLNFRTFAAQLDHIYFVFRVNFRSCKLCQGHVDVDSFFVAGSKV